MTNKKQRYDRDNTYIFARASIQIGAGDSNLYGCSYRIYGRRPVLRHQESETERRGYDQHGAKENLRQGKKVFLAIHGNGVHRPDSLHRDAVPGILDDMGRVLRVLRIHERERKVMAEGRDTQAGKDNKHTIGEQRRPGKGFC